ncbi:predicted protein [Naegleria gruberi]|uniref:Predicted protein n=1 Tax=Naegleria gruberi TaxID=5762 RepID=D2UZR1_NAEGR|nr:uncharacterized protein NAEGRDRAFT_62030 [Naegleria gruberi]EFC50205.1 predicted protein [Naegleria gruberi]|eukprot:XP_002682949.1 predicted protein [Naegleria gruberi strain NEG-M]
MNTTKQSLFRLVQFKNVSSEKQFLKNICQYYPLAMKYISLDRESSQQEVLLGSEENSVQEFEKSISDIEPSHIIQKPCKLYGKIPNNLESNDDVILKCLEKGTKLFSIEEFEKGEWRHVIIAPSLWTSISKQKKEKKGVKRDISHIEGDENNQDSDIVLSHNMEQPNDQVYMGYIPSHYAGKLNRKTIASKVKEPSTSSSSSITEETKEEGKSLHNEVISGYDNKTKTYSFSMKSIGIFHSVFPTKNGCPRQFGLVDSSKGKLEVTIPQGHMALDGLENFSHCIIMFVFHENSLESQDKVKIRPPRMNGNGKVGIYATRTPHRPNSIGLSVAKIEKIEGKYIYLSGADLIDGTPIIDIKPYIGRYDSITETRVPEWIQDDLFVQKIDESKIKFSQQSEIELQTLLPKLSFYKSIDEIKRAIIQVLQSDPRPVYMRKKRDDKLYGFRIDAVNVRCKFGDDDSIEIVTIELWE